MATHSILGHAHDISQIRKKYPPKNMPNCLAYLVEFSKNNIPFLPWLKLYVLLLLLYNVGGIFSDRTHAMLATLQK